MIYFMGLPRCGGQSITNIMGDIYPGLTPWHSVEADKWDDHVNESCSAVVECFAPIDYCLRSKIRPPHVFIDNYRDIDSWFESCLKVRQRAIEMRWNHPMWLYHPSQWRDYYWEYKFNLKDKLHSEGIEIRYASVFGKTTYREFLRECFLPCPDHLVNTALPNLDRYGRRFAALPAGITSPQAANEFYSALNPIFGRI